MYDLKSMERSSPLAAMRPPVMPGPWQGRSMTEYNPNYLAPYSNSFNFKDMSMARPRSNPPDYFSCKSVRESSPTSSLAVDLSQNFHIDKSPQLPTPRRSLFTTAFMRPAASTRTSLTPPIPSSSPGLDVDMMDHSPLPHKPAHPVLQQVVCSPTPEPTPPLADFHIPPPIVRTQSQPEDSSSPRQKRALAPSRPFVRRGFTSVNVPTRPKSAQPSAFQFGPPLQPLSKSALESFAESPPSDRKLPPSTSNSSLFGSTLAFVNNGSPLNIVRKPLANNGVQPRGRYRRTQSMQCNNVTKVVRQEKRFCTSGILQLQSSGTQDDDSYKLKLPHFKTPEDLDGLPRITKETCVDVLSGKYAAELGEYSIVDCRFEYEYEGGHIDGAVNFNDKEELAKRLFNDSVMSQKAIIFHCEYSAHRAPIMAKFIRQRDRAINQDNYPKLTYPEVYILDGGYSTFFQAHPSRCYPQNYVEMDSKDHQNACEMGMAKVKRRAKLSRAQTYAFGQSACPDMKISLGHDVSMSESPLVLHSTLDCMDIDFSSPIQMTAFRGSNLDLRPGLTFGPRRLESY